MKHLLATLLLFAVLPATAETELEACERIAAKWVAEQRETIASLEVRLPHQARVDIMTATTAWEADWAHKFHEGIGQALEYSLWTGLKGGVLLLIKDPVKEKPYIIRCKLICLQVGLEMRVEETE